MQDYWLLFIIYKFVKGYLVITFLLLLISSWSFHDVWQRYLYSQKPNFSMIRQKIKIFPIIKIAHFWNVMSIDMTLQKWAIFIMGVYGESSHFCRIKLKCRFWLYKKCWHTSWKFQLEIKSNKKVFAKKPLTIVYEMNR